MYRTTIFAAVLLAAQPGAGVAYRVVAGEGRLTSQAQEPANNGPGQAAENSAEQQPSANATSSTSPDKKAAPVAEKPATGASGNAIHKRQGRARRSSPPAATNGEPRKIVIHHGGATEPVTRIVPGITPEEAMRQREGAEQLLASSEGLLQKLGGRSLKPKQEGMVVQIRQYIDLATSALKESDTQRAQTLALKAYLLADDLVKQ